jgi:hypothetical protein
MLAAAHAEELRRSLDALRGVVEARLAERGRSLPRADESTRGRWPGGCGEEGLPPLSAFAGTGPLGTVVADCGLGAPEALVLVATIAAEIDERFAALLPLLTERPARDARFTGEAARNLIARSFEGRLRAASLLGPHARLRAYGLVRLEPGDEAPLAGPLTADRELVAYVLGRPPELPEHSPGFPAVPLQTVHRFEDIVLPSAVRDQLAGLIERVRDRGLVTRDWGFSRRHDNVEGIVALFHGPPGTGKSLAAAVVAREVGLPALAVDLSRLVSKWVGETSKLLARLFDADERVALVFDEADAVFGRRGEVTDARDRYASQEVSYLLQRIESHKGLSILTTNLLTNIDEAFLRRLHVVVGFPEPSVAERSALWRTVAPSELPLAEGIDFDLLAERYELTGAQIRDATLEAAYSAAADGRVVTLEHLETGIRRQYAKSGRMLPPG